MNSGYYESYWHGWLSESQPASKKYFDAEKHNVFFRLGRFSYLKRDAPLYCLLLKELYDELSSKLPSSTNAMVNIQLENHYSHKLIKTALAAIGYKCCDWQRHLREFDIYPIKDE